MGNCQAVEAAALVIQHPSGKIERLYWPVSASEVMKSNPGHYVSLIIPLPVPHSQHQEQNHQEQDKEKPVLFTHVKLLKPHETLTLGHAYRLIATQEVVQVLRARKHAKMRKTQATTNNTMQTAQPEKASSVGEIGGNLDTVNTYQTIRAGRDRLRAAPVNTPAPKPKSWHPTLHSISEAGI